MIKFKKSFIKNFLGCWLHERWQLECALNPTLSKLSGFQWQDLCNRNEELLIGDDHFSRSCQWKWSSFLTVARIFPKAGLRLLRKSFLDWPVEYGNYKERIERNPLLSIILPVGGKSHMKPFKYVLNSIWGQDMSRIECVVVDHSEKPTYRKLCENGVQYIHIERKYNELFNKSRAMNKGVEHANAPVVLLHDADIIIPKNYARNILYRINRGWEALLPIRFVFYLKRSFWDPAHEKTMPLRPEDIEAVGYNFPGGSTAVRRDIYAKMKGHAESFKGWGGEDNDFKERLSNYKLFLGGYAPVLHLWHPPSIKK